ncbi:MAG: hypothetical protein ACOY3E_01235 [Pseudomonadota bacterium]
MNVAKKKVSTGRASHPWSRVPAAPSVARRSAGKYATGIFPISASPFADRLEARVTAARESTDRLTPALLAKAFRGELVPQDPNDEPAAELLKRLATDNTTTTAKAKRGKKAHSVGA